MNQLWSSWASPGFNLLKCLCHGLCSSFRNFYVNILPGAFGKCLVLLSGAPLLTRTWIAFKSQHGYVITCSVKCGIKLDIRSQTSTLKSIIEFRDGIHICFISYFITDGIIYPCWDLNQSMSVKGAPEGSVLLASCHVYLYLYIEEFPLLQWNSLITVTP